MEQVGTGEFTENGGVLQLSDIEGENTEALFNFAENSS
jgi:hypothetical protein